MFVSLAIVLGLYLYEWFSTHSTKYIKSLEEKCKKLEIQVTQLEGETRRRDEDIASLLNQNERLELSISGRDMELHRALKRQDEEIRKLENTIKILRKMYDDEHFNRDWERNLTEIGKNLLVSKECA